jgi:hypothetical protein
LGCYDLNLKDKSSIIYNTPQNTTKSNRYISYGYCESIKSMEKDDPSLVTPLVMALLVDQISMIERLEDNKC